MSRITPVQNGVHSLAQALEAFRRFHGDPSDLYAMKDAVLRSHHALETLSKAVLFDYNPVFVLKGDSKISQFVQRYSEFVEGKNTYVVDRDFTIGLSESLERLRSIGAMDEFPEREYHQLRQAAKELEDYRNAIQHFAIRADPEMLARVLGNCLPRFVDPLEVLARSSGRYYGFGYQLASRLNNEGDIGGFRATLKKLFSESDEVIDLLRSRYDRLIGETATFFSGRTFEELSLTVSVRDHGRVGAPPYFPELTLDGFLDLKIEPHRIAFRSHFDEADPNAIEHYEGSVTLSRPRLESGGQHSFDSVVSGQLSLRATIQLPKVDAVLKLPGGEDYIPVLRNVEFTLMAELQYRATAMYDDTHYNVYKVLGAEGSLQLVMTAIPSGYGPEDAKHLVRASFTAALDSETAFRLHSFVKPGGELSDHYSLDWTLRAKGTCQF